MRWLPSALRDARREDGFTLFEMLTSMVIFSVVLAVAMQVLTTVQIQARDNLARVDAVQQARLGLANVDRQLRSAQAVYLSTDGMTLRAFLAVGTPRCVEFRVDATSASLTTRTWTDPNNLGEPRRTASYVVNAGRTPTAPAFTAPPGYAAPLVDVRLLVQPQTGTAAPVEVGTSLTARNGTPGAATSNVCTEAGTLP